MKLSFDIETSKPSGESFRLAIGITLPLVLVVAVVTLFGLT